jgi:drug/metabolite transporter superfamily protein YnfA
MSENELKSAARCGIVLLLSGFKPIVGSFFSFLWLLLYKLIAYLCPGTISPKTGIINQKRSDIGYPDRFQAYQGIFILGNEKSVGRLHHA